MTEEETQFVREFAAFARSKGDKQYDPSKARACALAQFGYPCATPETVPREVFRAATNFGLTYTFSALADRLEDLIA